MQFEWDPAKAESNQQKHGISFVEAASVFADPRAVTFSDPDHSEFEERWITLGFTHKGRVVFVAHAERDDRIRILSARRARGKELDLYG